MKHFFELTKDVLANIYRAQAGEPVANEILKSVKDWLTEIDKDVNTSLKIEVGVSNYSAIKRHYNDCVYVIMKAAAAKGKKKGTYSISIAEFEKPFEDGIIRLQESIVTTDTEPITKQSKIIK